MPESVKIYYFSGTGNSLSIAKDLQSHINNAEIISIAELMSSENRILIQGDAVGFVFPVHFARVPVFVEEFLERADFGRTDYIFAVANGGGAFCRTLKIFNGNLRKKGRALDAGFTIGMPGIHPKVHKFIKKSNGEFFRNKNIRVHEIAELVDSREIRPVETNWGLMGSLISHVLFKGVYNEARKHKLDRETRLNESCRKCGSCAALCPVGNITMTGAGPRWTGKCVNCARCYHLCQNRAIELGDDDMERYRNPEVSLAELTQ